jgi:hypothetical protein
VVRRIGLASKAVHEWSGDFSRRAFTQCVGRARMSVHRSATRVELPLAASTCVWCAQLVHILVNKICGQAGCGSPGSRVCLLDAARLSPVASSTCRSRAQDTHRLVNKICGQPWGVSARRRSVCERRDVDASSAIRVASMTCVGLAQVTHRLVTKNCGQERRLARVKSRRSANACALACTTHIPSHINDLARPCAGYSQAYPRKVLITHVPASLPVNVLNCACRKSPSHAARHDERWPCCPRR